MQQAIIKVAMMWNPAGAIIQLIQTAWDVYQWVKENAQRIFGLVQPVVDSMGNVVGNISGAAERRRPPGQGQAQPLSCCAVGHRRRIAADLSRWHRSTVRD